jgi:hypothetical protein
MVISIDSDQQAVTLLLEEIVRLCQAHGLEWHSQLRIEVRQGGMRLLAPRGAQGTLITLPTQLLVPLEGARWSAAPDRLELLEAPAEASDLQRQLLQLHGALYNATGKLPWWSQQHPARLVDHHPTVATALAAVKPHYGESRKATTPAEGFLATRSFNWKPDSDNSEGQAVLLPLIDLLNHHHRGAPFKVANGAMTMMVAQPDDTEECFAHYGHRRDPLDLALHYGHLDTSTPFAHGAPLEISLEGLGWVRVESQVKRRPAHPLDPPQVTLEGDGLRLSHLCCHHHHPQRVQTVLKLALQGSLKRRGHPDGEVQRLAEEAIGHLSSANHRMLHRLVEAVDAAGGPGSWILAEAARRQAAIITAVLT